MRAVKLSNLQKNLGTVFALPPDDAPGLSAAEDKGMRIRSA